MNKEITDKIRNTISIEDVIGRTVTLRKSHRGWVGLCPFHDDKSPSFHVYADSQSYYCFGCHESGDIFTFVMKTKNLTFPEALRLLADEAGISLAQSPNRPNSQNIYDVLNLAQEYFTSTFERLPAGKGYLQQRGISIEQACRYGLGYAQDSWSELAKYLGTKGVDPKTMVDAGLVIDGQHGMYDRFRGRVIFPVKDIAGRIIAFGGRAIVPNVGAKYINSPESPIYSKRRNLYLLNVAGSVIREKGYSILCEGYMDALRLHLSGFRETVASLGTSLTAEQAGLLKRFADNCYICYDGDTAGKIAALRGMYILAENGLNVRVISLPDGQDPDEFLRANPPSSFQKAIDDALPLIPYHINTLKPDLDDSMKRDKALTELWEGVKKLNPYYSLRWTASLAATFLLPPEEMKRRILEGREIPHRTKISRSLQPETVDNGIECAFCSMLAKHKEYRLNMNAEELHALIRDDEAMHTASAILESNPDELLEIWRNIDDTAKLGVIARGNILLSEMREVDDHEKWEKIIAKLERSRIMRRIRELEAKIKMNAATLEESGEFMELRKKLLGLQI